MKRRFIIYSESWFYEKNRNDEIWIMVGDDDDNVSEFCLKWDYLDEPKIEAFPDAIDAMLACTDLIEIIRDIEIGESDKYWNYSPSDVKQILLDLGFEDITEREDPEAVKSGGILFDKDKVWELFNDSPEFRDQFVKLSERFFSGRPR